MTLSPEQLREQIRINEEAAALAGENVELREEVRLLRKALDSALAAAATYEQADKERQEVIRVKDVLLKIADEKIAEERRAGKKRALRWGLFGVAAGVIVAAVAGGN